MRRYLYFKKKHFNVDHTYIFSFIIINNVFIFLTKSTARFSIDKYNETMILQSCLQQLPLFSEETSRIQHKELYYYKGKELHLQNFFTKEKLFCIFTTEIKQ
jgi:hypothetical protein